MILAKIFNLLSSSSLQAVIILLSKQAASGQGKFCREALHRVDVVPHLVHTEVAAAAGMAGKSDCKSVLVHQTLTRAQPEAAK